MWNISYTQNRRETGQRNQYVVQPRIQRGEAVIVLMADGAVELTHWADKDGSVASHSLRPDGRGAGGDKHSEKWRGSLLHRL